MSYLYKTRGTCSTQIEVTLDGDIVKDVKFTGGCNGNLQAIPKLVQGMTVDEVEKIILVDCYDYMMDSLEIGLEVHVMLYKLDKGYVEIPYRIGRMGSEEIRKCSIEEARDNNFNDIKPKRFSYYDSFAEYCAGDAFFKHLGEEREFDDGLFVELPNVYELDYVYEEEGFDGETYIETEIEETINVDSLILMQYIPACSYLDASPLRFIQL